MIADQLGKGVVIIVNQDPRDEIGIIEWHPGSLHLWGRIFFAHVQSPDQEVAESDQKRDNSEAPGAAFPIVDGGEENHQTRADHEKGDAAAQVRTLPHDRRWIQERLGNRLAFLDHHPNGFVHGAALGEAEIHDQSDDRDGQAKDRQRKR